MKCSVLGDKPRVIEGEAGKLLEDGSGAPLAINARGTEGAVQLPLHPLQRMIEDILDPRALPQRTVKGWRSLYKSFFSFFAPGGEANEAERNAWAIAVDVFNTNLVAVSGRTTQVVPMTFQDFVDGADSFRHDGLREGAQRDIAWQPKKILLLMAGLVGRILAGWQADANWTRESRQDLFPFREHLIAANREARFLESVFDFDARFSILDYRAAGLKPLLHAFPHFAHALMENRIDQCEFRVSLAAQNPPLLQAHFLRPLRLPGPLPAISRLSLALRHKPLPPNTGSQSPATQSSYFEFSRTALEALTFGGEESPETKCSRIEELFELAVTDGLLVCGPQRADAATAAKIGKTLGRTQAEQFIIERFFALGFRSGHGSEPWLDQSREPHQPDPARVKQARKQFARWKDTLLFFLNSGHPQAADLPGARIRQEALQPKGSDVFLSLLRFPVYAPLMKLFLAVDSEGKWLVDEPELHAFSRSLHKGTAKILIESREIVERCADSLNEQEKRGVFLFEFTIGVLSSVIGENKRRLASLERAKAALRGDYERLFMVSLETAPSVLRAAPANCPPPLSERRRCLEEAEQTILKSLGEPFTKHVSERLRGILTALPRQTSPQVEQPAPRIQIANKAAFEESVGKLSVWIESRETPAPIEPPHVASQWLVALVELRALAEEGNAAKALESAMHLYPTLSESRRQALAPFFGELSWALIREIELQLEGGNEGQATAMARRARPLMDATHSRDDFVSLLDQLFASRSANKPLATPEPSHAPGHSRIQGPRSQQAEVLLREHAEELSMAEHHLEQEFLEAVREGSDSGFKRKEKLRNRLQRHTRWGGREPYNTTLKLLESSGAG